MTTIYHYCPLGAFQSIVRSGYVRLTDLHQSNDRKEGLEVLDVMRAQMLAIDPSNQYIDKFLEKLSRQEYLYQGFGFCLSRAPDVLSQWRGYASDGTGVMIGFNRERIEEVVRDGNSDSEMSYSLRDVDYSAEKDEVIMPLLAKPILNCLRDGGLEPNDGPWRGLMGQPSKESLKKRRQAKHDLDGYELAINIFIRFALKNKGFEEEKETRLFAAAILPRDDEATFGQGQTSKYLDEIDFFDRNGKMIPFCKFDIDERFIDEVVIGPRCETPKHVFRKFLTKFEFEDIDIRYSKIPYG